jgi:hypothetical protein
MTEEREKEIQQSVIKSISAFGIDFSLSHQSISFVGLQQFRRDVSVKEFVTVLKAMQGVELDTEKHEIRVPTSYFK